MTAVWASIWFMAGFCAAGLVSVFMLESLTLKYKKVVRQAYEAGRKGLPITAVFTMRDEK